MSPEYESRKDLIPREVRETIDRFGLPEPIWYVGRYNGEPGNYRAITEAELEERARPKD